MSTTPAQAPTLDSVMDDLRSRSSEKTAATFVRHGSPADGVLGVSVADLKEVAKTIKGRQDVALELYDTGKMEAQYLAGMVAKGSQMTPGQLTSWAEKAVAPMISEYTVPWVTVENPSGRELALQWMDSDSERVASAGWCTYSGLITTTLDTALNLEEIEGLLQRVASQIHEAKNRVRYTMNGFVIAVGTYIQPLHFEAKATAQQIGDVSVDVGHTACKVPIASAYLEKAEEGGKVGQKKKTIRC